MSDSYIKDSIKELVTEVSEYEPSPARMPVGFYVERKTKSILRSLIGEDESLIGILSPDKSNETIEAMNREMATRNAFRREMRERAGL